MYFSWVNLLQLCLSREVKRADGREYTCVASNRFGSKVIFLFFFARGFCCFFFARWLCLFFLQGNFFLWIELDLTFAFSGVFFLVPQQLISVLCLESSAFFPSAILHDVCRLVSYSFSSWGFLIALDLMLWPWFNCIAHCNVWRKMLYEVSPSEEASILPKCHIRMFSMCSTATKCNGGQF